MITIDPQKCKGCGICEDVCPAGAIHVQETARVDPAKCTECGLCVRECPTGAISWEGVRRTPPPGYFPSWRPFPWVRGRYPYPPFSYFYPPFMMGYGPARGRRRGGRRRRWH